MDAFLSPSPLPYFKGGARATCHHTRSMSGGCSSDMRVLKDGRWNPQVGCGARARRRVIWESQTADL